VLLLSLFAVKDKSKTSKQASKQTNTITNCLKTKMCTIDNKIRDEKQAREMLQSSTWHFSSYKLSQLINKVYWGKE